MPAPETSVTRKVICAACRHGDLIIAGARHFDKVMHSQMKFLRPDIKPPYGSCWEQGFIDQFGVFMTREEAMQVARDSGQPVDMKRNGRESNVLYSEGLY